MWPAVGLLDLTIDYDLFLALCITVLNSLLPGAFISVGFCDALGDLFVALVKSRPTLTGFFLPPLNIRRDPLWPFVDAL